MLKKLNLFSGETFLGILEVYEVDQPWFNCHFVATEAFEAIKLLFDREVALVKADNFDQEQDAWEEFMEQIDTLALRLIEVNAGEKINDFLLHIENNEAWFRY